LDDGLWMLDCGVPRRLPAVRQGACSEMAKQALQLQVEGSKYKREFKPKKAVALSEAGIRATNNGKL